jgi:hypothetical protein
MLGWRTPIPLFALTILLVVPAEATTSYYQGSSGETAFNAAVAGLTLLNPTLTFSASDLGPGGLFNANGTGINFLGFDDFGSNNPKDYTVNAGKLTATLPAEVTKITFPVGGVYAFGFHITVTSGFGNWCIDLTTSGCSYNIVNSSSSDKEFFGFVGNAPVTAPLYIHPVSGGPVIVFTDFEAYSQDSSVPEAHTMLLVGLGLVILPLARRKTRRAM